MECTPQQAPPTPPSHRPIAVDITPPPPKHDHPQDWTMLVLGSSLSAPSQIASSHNKYPLTIQFMCLAFSSVFVAKCKSRNHPNLARLLGYTGVFFGFTGFFMAITFSFLPCLKIVSWVVYVLSLLAILLGNRELWNDSFIIGFISNTYSKLRTRFQKSPSDSTSV